MCGSGPVSYTHLDVYKRQGHHTVLFDQADGHIPLAAVGQRVAQQGVGCLLYTSVDASAEQDKALDIIENAKASRPSVCNAAECV